MVLLLLILLDVGKKFIIFLLVYIPISLFPSPYSPLSTFLSLLPSSSDSVEYCSSSTGTMSLSRCQLFEAGFSAGTLHLNDPSCNGTLQDGRVEFLFDNENHLCETTLRVQQLPHQRFTYTFSHLADAFIQSDLQGIYIYTSGAVQGFSLAQGHLHTW